MKIRSVNRWITVFIAIWCLIVNVAIASEFSVSLGSTGEGEITQRLSYMRTWDNRWFDSSMGHLSGAWDMGYTHWLKGSYGHSAHALSLSPVLIYLFHTKSRYQPFVEFGVGVSFFNTTKVGSQKLGSSFNFEDRIGAGIKVGGHRFGIRIIHYSNLGISKPNQGIESYALYYNYQF